MRFRRARRGDQHLPAVAGRGWSAMWAADRASVRVLRDGAAVGVRRPGLPPGGLPRGHPLERERVHVHVDERGPLLGGAETSAIWHRAETHALSLLDGFHVGVRRHVVLPPAPRLQQTQLRSRRVHLHAWLGQHGRLLRDRRISGPGSEPHHHNLRLFLHLLHDEQASQRRPHSRQGIRFGTVGKPC